MWIYGIMEAIRLLNPFKKKVMVFDFECGKKVVGKYDQIQVDSVNAIMTEINELEVTIPQAAYILATAWHESRLKPIEEWGGYNYLDKYDTGALAKALGNTPEDDDDGQFYAGKGYVMLTGRRNYAKQARRLNIDLLQKPELALRVDIAANILVYGMVHGDFTGRKLSDYINEKKSDFLEARRIINSKDKAALIEGYAKAFLGCLS